MNKLLSLIAATGLALSFGAAHGWPAPRRRSRKK
jgi:hypothetical protein